MIVFLQTLLMLRAVLMDWLFWRVTGADSPAESGGGPEEEDQATAEYDEERGVVFYPPVYAQRYAAVIDLLQDPRWVGRLEKVVDLGYHDTSFIKYLKEVPGVHTILGVDVDTVPLAHDLFKHENYATEREEPLTVVLFQGNAADPDYRLIGCDAVISIEMVEHMLPHDLERLIHTVFGFIRPWVAIFTTPNADFNVLFKSMLANGFRNWDHKFEWTRGQFNEWCGNIVCRYPDYSVFSHGVGPGPPDTAHLGCCTQLALFVNREYQKRTDLTPDALSLVTKIQPSENPSQKFTKENAGEPPPDASSKCNLEPPSVTILDHPDKSSLTVFIGDTTEPIKEVPKVSSSDKPAQCDLAAERAKGYLMTSDDETCLSILRPDRTVKSKVYDMEDVNCRLNCSTVQVKRFSAKSSMLMSNVKSDSQLRTEEVIGELKHLTRMLNMNRGSGGRDSGETVWNNINWGENAPYWNQYYTIVKEYEYPFQTKSPSERILDLVSDEIHRIVDQVDEDEWFFESGRLEIDISRLMPVVKHLTEDVGAVRDLLEWNGYQMLNDKVVYSRLVSDDQNAQDTDAEWDLSEAQSTVASDGTVEADCSDEVLGRAIERKLHHLRSALRNDRDIASELTSVVDKLTSLALRHCGDPGGKRQRWMKHKLYDLLSLSEKAVQRRGTPSEQSQTPACEKRNESFTDIKISLISICTQKTFQHEVSPISLEHEEWINNFKEEFNSENSIEDDIVTLSGFDMSEDTTPFPNECAVSIGTYNVLNSSPLNSLLLSSPGRLSPVKICKQLDRNIYTKGALKPKRSPLSLRKMKKLRNAEIVKALTTPRPLKELKGMVQCFYSRTERRKKAHKKKLRKYIHNLKTQVNKLNSYEPMVQLTEKDEDIKSSYSKEIDVFDLSNETESWINDGTYEYRQRSFTTRGKQEFYAPFFVADNKVYRSEESQSPECDLLDQNVKSDYSEPSTSTGVRHTTAYVQCDASAFTSPYISTSISQYTRHDVNASPCPSGQTQSSGVVTDKISTNKEVGVSATNLPTLARNSKGSTLARDGIHFHSFKEKRKNEGVVYQGHWQEQAKENNTPPSRPKTTPENNKKTHLTGRQVQLSEAKIQLNNPKVFSNYTKMTVVGKKIHSKNYINENSKFLTIKSDISPKIQPHVKNSLLSSPGREVTKSSVLPKDRSQIKSPIKKPSFNESLTKSKVLKTLQNTRNQSISPETSNMQRIYDISRGYPTNRAVASPNKNGNFGKSPSEYSKSYNANRMMKSFDNVNKRTKKIDSILTNVNNIPCKVLVKRSANRFTLMLKNDTEDVGTTDFVQKTYKTAADGVKEAQKENMEPKSTLDNPNENYENVERASDSDLRTFGRRDLVINKNSLVAQAFSGCSIKNNTSPGSSKTPIASLSHGENDSGRQTASEDTSMSQHTSDLMPGKEEQVAPRQLFDLNNQSHASLAIPEPTAAAGGGREVAGAGDGRGVHLSCSTSDEYSSSLLSTDTSISDAFQSLNLDGIVMAGTVPLQDMPESPSSSCSGSTAETRVRVEVRARTRTGVGRTGPQHEHSQSGVDADVSSADAEVNDN